MNLDKSLKIAMLGHKRIPSREGGIEIVVEELATRMVALGHQVTCYNRKGHHVSGKKYDTALQTSGFCKKRNNIQITKIIRYEYKGINLVNVPTLNVRGFAAMSASVFAAIRAALGQYDVVHFHAEGPCAMLWLPKRCGKRCICTIHGLDWQRAKWGRLAKAYILLGERCAAKYADEIIVLSDGVRQYFKDTYNRETRFIPNGVSRPRIREADWIQQRFGLKKDSYILFLGRLVPEKGLRYLIDAFKKVRTHRRLVIAGGSSDTDSFADELKKSAKEDKRILFTGFVQGEVLDELYSNAFVYVLPSDVEGMPLSLLEAMSYGNCCLVSDIDECAAVVEDKALIFRKSDVDDLADKLQMACDQEKLVAEYKREAADFICRKYNWDSVVKETLLIYRS